jgi:hypothetical protein
MTQQCKLIFASNHVMMPMTKATAFSNFNVAKKTSSIFEYIVLHFCAVQEMYSIVTKQFSG